MWAEEMTHWVKGLAAKPDDASSIPRTHIGRESSGSHMLPSNHHMHYTDVCEHV